MQWANLQIPWIKRKPSLKQPRDKLLGPIIYAALLTTQEEAGPEIQRFLAQVRYEHGSIPTEQRRVH